MNTYPRVSIVIPVFNGANYLREAIDSALSQTYPNVEVLVVNDGSTDGTEAIALSYGHRIRYLPQANGGVASALNRGLQEMRGEYFSWLSHDDVYMPRKVEAQMSRISSGVREAIVFCDYEFIDPQGRRLGVKRFGGHRGSMRVAIIASDPINGCTVLVPRRCFERYGFFDVALRTTQDYDMWFRLAEHYEFVHVPAVLVRSRVHPHQGVRTIPTHHTEATRQFARFIEALSVDEIQPVHRGPLSAFYSGLALNMKLRGFDGAAMAALTLSRRHAAGDGLVIRARNLFVVVACALLTRKLKPRYWATRIRAGRSTLGLP